LFRSSAYLIGPQNQENKKHLAPQTKITSASCPKCFLEKYCPKAIKSKHESKQHEQEKAFKIAFNHICLHV